VKGNPVLEKVIRAIQLLKHKSNGTIPIIGVVMSPFSLPVMQMGFDRYIELMLNDPDAFNHLMKINELFCVEWANAQLEAGATAICYFDPVSSSTVVSREEYYKLGWPVAKRTVSDIKGATATHFASGRCLPIIDLVGQTGTAVVGVSADEDMAALKKACAGKMTLLGNLNGISMRKWTRSDAEQAVKDVIYKAARGGGLILADNHGEIPLQVPDEVLLSVSEAVQRFGQYPIRPE
jgi:uroporphyrinogen decarboxylase